MDGRWQPISRDSKRNVKIVLHPTASIWEVRRGMDPGSDDSIDLSAYVKDATQTAFDAKVTLAFNRELFGPIQPKPNQVIEFQLWQNNEWKPLWIGHVDSITSFTMSRGERQMQLSAKTRDQQPIWRNSPRVSPMYPLLTDLVYMAQRAARDAQMKGDEIVLPPSSITTAHSNTQMADMTTWEMVKTIFQALGWEPFIDGQGRLRAADRGLQARRPDIKLDDTRMIKVGGSRQKPPINRVRVIWLDPQLKKWKQQGRMVGNATVTIGYWTPYWFKDIYFSEDQTQRAIADDPKKALIKNPGVNKWVNFCIEKWEQTAPNKGRLTIINNNFWLIWGLMIAHAAKISTRSDDVAGAIPVATPMKDELWATVGGVGVSEGPVSGYIAQAPGTLRTIPSALPIGSIWEGILFGGLMAAMMNIGTGNYEIWGTPYDWVHARNISEAYDESVPTWVNNVQDITCDLITNEEHAKAVAIRELIYSAWSANKWSVTIVDDPRVEYGDILEFPDGSQLFVEDFSRRVSRGEEAVLDVSGFLLGRVRGGAGSQLGAALPPGSSILPGQVIPPGPIVPPAPPGPGEPGGPGGPPVYTGGDPRSLLPELNAEREKYGPTMTNDECVQMMNDVAKAENTKVGSVVWGLLKKTEGERGTMPGGGTDVKIDVLVFKPSLMGVDCITMSGNNSASTPEWHDYPGEWTQHTASDFVTPV